MDAGQRVNLVFLDACRDNPLTQTMDRKMATRQANVGSGLAQIAQQALARLKNVRQ